VIHEEDNDAKKNLRKAHFHFGDDKLDYKTITAADYAKKTS